MTSFIQGMADRDLPLHVFHFDCFWMREFRWCDFEWDATRVSRPARHAATAKRARPAHLRLDQSLYRAALAAVRGGQGGGYLLKKPNGDVWQTDQWQAGMGIVDFTNPDACQWYGDKLRALLDMGVDCFKTDFGERIPTDVVYAGWFRPAEDAQLLLLPL